MFKRILIPPLIPVLLLAILAIWVIIDETQSAPRIIDGRPDDAPIRAAGILFFIAPLLYLPLGLLNLVDSLFDRFSSRVGWVATVGIWSLLSTLLTTIFYHPEVDSSVFSGVGFAILVSFIIIVPMALLRRFFLTARKEQPTLIPGTTVPFKTLFPGATSVPKLKRIEQDGQKRDFLSQRGIRIIAKGETLNQRFTL